MALDSDNIMEGTTIDRHKRTTTPATSGSIIGAAATTTTHRTRMTTAHAIVTTTTIIDIRSFLFSVSQSVSQSRDCMEDRAKLID